MKKMILCAAVALCGAAMPAIAAKKSLAEGAGQTVWMRFVPKGDGASQTYIACGPDGSTTVREQNGNKVYTRTGKINRQLVKDLLQEMKTNGVFDSALANPGRMLFYKGFQLQLSALWEGEVRTADVYSEKLSQSFRLALSDLKTEALKLPLDTSIHRFVVASPVVASEAAASNAAEQRKVRQAYKYLETSALEQMPALQKAIERPYQLMPLLKKEETETLNTFLLENKLRQSNGDFVLACSRGDYKIELVRTSY